jgi:lipopolysaccharide/colanic/teichoic acid biosynthesis glycosyltransferase
MKRAVDVAVALAVLGFGLPVWAIIGLAIRLTSKGPALFRMRVVGQDGRRFTMFKFRTMTHGNDNAIHREAFARFARGETLASVGETPVYKLVNDPRVTALGRLLRKSGMDEIPQLLNVLRGEMSIVGPRPSQEYEYEHYTPEQRRRFTVLPGITGLHQVAGRSSVPFDEMVRLDLSYVDSHSVAGDLGIMLRTVWVMIAGRGAH